MNETIDLREVAARWLESLEWAGLTDLPARSIRQLGALELPPRKAESVAESPAALQPAAIQVESVQTPIDKTEMAHQEQTSELSHESPPASSAEARRVPNPRNSARVPLQRALTAEYGPSRERGEREKLLNELALTVAGCTRCPELASCRTQTVFGVGTATPRLVFFGEAPGAEEDRLGEPFVGRAGELLDRILAACNLKREEIYIFNTVKCRPPGNRNPNDDELANCREYFETQLEILQPEFICCLGSVAARTLLNTREAVGRLRGSIHNYRNSRVVVTYHPAYLLRNPAAKASTWQDMQMLLGAMGIAVSEGGAG